MILIQPISVLNPKCFHICLNFVLYWVTCFHTYTQSFPYLFYRSPRRILKISILLGKFIFSNLFSINCMSALHKKKVFCALIQLFKSTLCSLLHKAKALLKYSHYYWQQNNKFKDTEWLPYRSILPLAELFSQSNYDS